MRRQCYGYIRVSTTRQGEHGVSLSEQRDAIERFASHNRLQITQWFEERETAAKSGRPVFGNMIRLLRRGVVNGVVIHKIDRSARNLRDWADLGELIDLGVEVHFANESLDLNSRGGRLSADIQAVVAADFIRNLRQETKKGFYGRLKQGLYPMPAPIGYRDGGPGEPKTIDPVMGPLVRLAFEKYATGRFTLRALPAELGRAGLRNRGGGPVTRNGLSVMLNNPFYIGLIKLRSTGETFPGAHDPLVSTTLFNRVQAILRGKTITKTIRHDFLFRRLVKCGGCDRSLIGEQQRGHTYYRCQTRKCPTTGIREEVLDTAALTALAPLRFNDAEKRYLTKRLAALKANLTAADQRRRRSRELRAASLRERLGRLTDAYLDQTIDKELFEERKTALLVERQEIKDELEREPTRPISDRIAEFLELAGSAYLSYKLALPEEKRELLDIVTSNRSVAGKTPVFTLRAPFDLIANRPKSEDGRASRAKPRTLDTLVAGIGRFFECNNGLPYPSFMKTSKLSEIGKG